MAGLGFKDFQVGEVLTSSDVDGYLMQQAAMRFADSAARGSALGTAVGTAVALAEGMLSYLDDANILEVFDGTAWGGVKSIMSSDIVAQTADQDTTSSTFVAVTDFDIDVTPTNAANKVLLLVTFQMRSITDFSIVHEVELRRDSTSLATTQTSTVVAVNQPQSGAIAYLDSPGTTSTVNYNVRYRGALNASRGSRIQNRQLVAVEFRP